MSVLKWSYSIISLMLGLVGPYLYYAWDQWYLLIPISLFLTLIDFAISDNPWKNVAIMKLNGLSTTYIWGVSIFNIIYVQLMAYNIYRIILKDEPMPIHIDLQLIIPVFVILGIGDYLFYISHKWLHSTQFGAKLHLMHHCCIHTSISTNLWFHPLDLLIEFFGPFTINYLYWVYSRDTFTLIVVAGIMQAWYSGTHDENIANHHRDHHRLINSDYPIYISYNIPNRNDKVKHMIKTNE